LIPGVAKSGGAVGKHGLEWLIIEMPLGCNIPVLSDLSTLRPTLNDLLILILGHRESDFITHWVGIPDVGQVLRIATM
jgi:hypothetical protein